MSKQDPPLKQGVAVLGYMFGKLAADKKVEATLRVGCSAGSYRLEPPISHLHPLSAIQLVHENEHTSAGVHFHCLAPIVEVWLPFAIELKFHKSPNPVWEQKQYSPLFESPKAEERHP